LSKNQGVFQSAIIKWYKKNKRNFPWRETNDPFKIIIAEVILKMTGAWKSANVYTYLASHYGTPKKMAAVDAASLQFLFRPLGLFHRSQTLINIAKDIVARFKGKVPEEYEELLSIKGIGRYIANAVLCLAYNKRCPLVDQSVSRVFKRCFNYQSEKPAYSDKRLWELAYDFLPKKNYVQYNLGLLDLGAIICKYRHPLHEECPIKSICYAYKEK
jgi:A/G-specific adenine glycosylase